jgi:hypothetical protein
MAERANWRRGRDSNPRYGCPYAAFRVRCFQPLSHLSAVAWTGARSAGPVESKGRVAEAGAGFKHPLAGFCDFDDEGPVVFLDFHRLFKH